MTNTRGPRAQQGFIVPILLAVIIALLIATGYLLYANKKVSLPADTNTNTNNATTSPDTSLETSSSTSEQTAANTTVLGVAGMKQYTDTNFGFSFWYPATWRIKEGPTAADMSRVYEGGTFSKTITVTPQSSDGGVFGDGISIIEFTSSGKSITDNSNCGPAEGCPVSVRYYFDSTSHAWMKYSALYGGGSRTDVADISNNSMGGLHIFHGNARFGDNVIVPLSAKNFLVVQNTSTGTNRIEHLANTIVALNPAVATPVNIGEQNKQITIEGVLYGALGTALDNGQWFIYNNLVYDNSGNIVIGADAATFKPIHIFSDGYVSTVTGFATDRLHVYHYASMGEELNNADPLTFTLIRQAYQVPYTKTSGKYGQSFTSYDLSYEKDKSHVWYGGTLIPGADPATFVVTGNTYQQNADGTYTMAHDAKHVYGTNANGKVTVDGVTI